MSRIAEVLTSDELAQLKAQAEAMSLEELTDFALKALEEVKAELGEKEERQVAEEQRVVGSDKAERGGEKPAISTESKGS